MELVADTYPGDRGRDFSGLCLKALTSQDYEPTPKVTAWIASQALAAHRRDPLGFIEYGERPLECLLAIQDRFPEKLDRVRVGPQQKAIGDVLFQTVLEHEPSYGLGQRRTNADFTFAHFLEDRPMIEGFSRLVDLPARAPDLKRRCQYLLSQTGQLKTSDEAVYHLLGLLAILAKSDGELRHDLTEMLMLVDLKGSGEVESFVLTLFQAEFLKRKVTEQGDVPLAELGSQTAFLLRASHGLSDLQEQVYSNWEARLKKLELPILSGQREEACQRFLDIDQDTTSLPLSERWERWTELVREAGGDLEKGWELYRFEADQLRSEAKAVLELDDDGIWIGDHLMLVEEEF